MASQTTGENSTDSRSATLGDVLYAENAPAVPEQNWVALIRSIAEHDQAALHALYERMHRLVFTLAMRITLSRETAEEVTLDVFHDVWRRAATYDPASGTVIGWVMNQARSRAIDRLRFEQRKKRMRPQARCTVGGLVENAMHASFADTHPTGAGGGDPQEAFDLAGQARRLREALTVLSTAERLAIETTFFSGLTHAEAAVRLDEPLGTVKTRIRSGLRKLREALVKEGRDA